MCGSAGFTRLAADGHKWLLGPGGLRDSVRAARHSGSDRAGGVRLDQYRRIQRLFLPGYDASRRRRAVECGTLNTIGIYGLRAAMEFLLEVGVERIAPAVQALADRVEKVVTAHGYRVLQPRTPGDRGRNCELPA